MTDTLSLRVATLDDIAALDSLFQRSYMALLADDYPPSVLVTAVPVIGRAQPDLIRSGLFYVVCDGKAIVGAGGWSLQAPGGRPGQRGVGHVRHVATDPAALRRGVGQRIIDAVKTQARGSGMMELQCLSTLTAVPFYEAMGFVELSETVVALRGGIDFRAVAMSARL